jgi:hypothetical protein
MHMLISGCFFQTQGSSYASGDSQIRVNWHFRECHSLDFILLRPATLVNASHVMTERSPDGRRIAVFRKRTNLHI